MLQIGDMSNKCALGFGLALAMSAPCSSALASSVVLHAFGGKDGSFPAAGLVADAAGNLYGTSHYGGGGCGGSGCGTVFEVAPDGTSTVIYAFSGGKDGGLPVSNPRLTMSNGNLYGTTFAGGANGFGIVFELSPSGGKWTETSLYSFAGGNDGANPWGAPVFDSNGNLYGTTTAGGTNNDGTVYKLAPNGTETVLHAFTGADGQFPANGLITFNGNIYGTTQLGGASGQGTIFGLTASGTEALYSFTGGNDGGQPLGALLADRKGDLFGTTSSGGGECGFRCVSSGTVFELKQNGALVTLYTFSGGSDGSSPRSTLVADARGNIYGTTRYGGAGGAGTVFLFASDGVERVLHSFRGEPDGNQPFEGVIMDSDGYLYGTTVSGGNKRCDQYAIGCGVVFKVKE